MIDVKNILRLAGENQPGKPKVEESGRSELKHIEMPKKSSPSSETLYELYEQVKLVADNLCQVGKDITTIYPEWRDVGFSLADGLGEQGRPIFHQISSLYPNYK